MWIVLLVIGVVGVLGISFVLLTRFGTIYLSHWNGFMACGSGSRHVHKISHEDLRPLFAALLTENTFDHLFISSDDVHSNGFCFALSSGTLSIEKTFCLSIDAALEESFRESMKLFNLELIEDSLYNEDMELELEARALTYKCPCDIDKMASISKHLVERTFPKGWDQVFAEASMIGSGPKLGLSWKRDQDLLKGLLK
jgi:hypothetical protein